MCVAKAVYLQQQEKVIASSLIQIKSLLKVKNNEMKTNGTEIIFNIRL